MSADIISFHPSVVIIDAVAAEIDARWGDAFCWPQQPLAVGLGKVILAALASTPPQRPPWQTMTDLQLEAAVDSVLEIWTSAPRYLALATTVGRPRVGLYGEPLGRVTKDEAEWARAKFRRAFCAGPLAPTPEQVQNWLNTGCWALIPEPRTPGTLH
jgi:hypothetical protein